MCIAAWGLGIRYWTLGTIPTPQSPFPNPQSPYIKKAIKIIINKINQNF